MDDRVVDTVIASFFDSFSGSCTYKAGPWQNHNNNEEGIFEHEVDEPVIGFVYSGSFFDSSTLLDGEDDPVEWIDDLNEWRSLADNPESAACIVAVETETETIGDENDPIEWIDDLDKWKSAAGNPEFTVTIAAVETERVAIGDESEPIKWIDDLDEWKSEVSAVCHAAVETETATTCDEDVFIEWVDDLIQIRHEDDSVIESTNPITITL